MDMMKASAWWTAALSGGAKLPELKELLSHEPKRRRDKPQSLKQLKGEWAAFFARARPA